MIQSYKQNPKIDTSYDVIIIGTGLGGLSTAAFLSKTGKKVLLLERHYTAGGFTHIFKRKDFEWDVGIHYVGQMQNPKSAMRKLFDYITDGEMKWADMGEIYDRIIIGNKKFDLIKGLKNWKNKMYEYFPDEKDVIDKYIDLIFAANKAGRNYQMEKALPPIVGKFIGSFLKKPLYKFSDQTTYEVLSALTKNEELIKVLTGQYGDYGLPPKKSSFYMHAILVSHYFGGGSFPVGGSSQIAKNIDTVIEKAGGTILTHAEVEEVIVENNVAKGVLMKDGKSLFADKIVSGTGAINTFKKLLPKESIKKHHLDQKLQKINPSVGHICLYLGLDGTPEELDLPKTNLWIYPVDCDHDTCVNRYIKDTDQPFPVVYISFPAAKDPDWKNRFPGKSTIEIITLVPFETFAAWEGTQWMKRGKDYTDLKEKFTKRLLEELYKQLPHLKGKVSYSELSSPLTTQHFVNYEKGEIYGVDHSPERFRQDFLKPRTPIKNFYLTGQDIVSCGIGGALFSGVLTATAMTGTNFINKVMKGK